MSRASRHNPRGQGRKRQDAKAGQDAPSPDAPPLPRAIRRARAALRPADYALLRELRRLPPGEGLVQGDLPRGVVKRLEAAGYVEVDEHEGGRPVVAAVAEGATRPATKKPDES